LSAFSTAFSPGFQVRSGAHNHSFVCSSNTGNTAKVGNNFEGAVF
jgi:hypothetical protein